MRVVRVLLLLLWWVGWWGKEKKRRGGIEVVREVNGRAREL